MSARAVAKGRRPRVVVIEGEDAAPEAVRPSLAVLGRLAPEVEWVQPLVGRPALDRGLPPFPDEARAAIDGADATLFGATSGASAPALFYLRWGKATYANLRPVRWRPGAKSPLARPEGIDLVIVRENLEDLYLGVEGDVADLAPLGLVSVTARRPVAELAPGRFALKVITEAGTERVARFAFDLARRRRAADRPGCVTCATKHNMLRQSDGLFRAVVERVAAGFPDIPLEVQIVDDFARRLVADPQSLDVVVLPNLYGDILSDAAAGLVGGLGLAPTGCYGDAYAYFEPAHGTAPDLAGRGTINPTATLLSGALLLEHLGLAAEAARLDAAVDRVYAEGKALTPDQGGSASARAFCEAVVRALEG